MCFNLCYGSVLILGFVGKRHALCASHLSLNDVWDLNGVRAAVYYLSNLIFVFEGNATHGNFILLEAEIVIGTCIFFTVYYFIFGYQKNE